MKINAKLIVSLRSQKSWSQDDLATAASLSTRTIQRVENSSTASLQTKKALASALDIDVQMLDFEDTLMRPCPTCNSTEVYQYKDYF